MLPYITFLSVIQSSLSISFLIDISLLVALETKLKNKARISYKYEFSWVVESYLRCILSGFQPLTFLAHESRITIIIIIIIIIKLDDDHLIGLHDLALSDPIREAYDYILLSFSFFFLRLWLLRFWTFLSLFHHLNHLCKQPFQFFHLLFRLLPKRIWLRAFKYHIM